MTSPEDGLVGVVVPARDAGRWLDALLSSLEAQTYRNWRGVVVDDGSTDDSVDVAERHEQSDSRIRLVLSPRPGGGAPVARSFGRTLLEDAEFLFFPDADDVLEPDLISTLVERLRSDPEAAAAFCRYARIDEEGRLLNEPVPGRIAMTRRWVRRLRDDEDETPFETIYGWAAPAAEGVIVFRARAFDEVGGWDWPEMGGDSIDLLCRLIADGGRVLFEPRPLYLYRRHGTQHTTNIYRYTIEAPAQTRQAWLRRAERDPTLVPLVARAEYFVAHRLIPWNGLLAAGRHARRGHLATAARFLVGAARRYRWRAPAEFA